MIDGSSVEEVYGKMQKKLGTLVPDFELKLKAELVYEIQRLKQERGAVILGHNYMEPVLFHTIPDFVGDSLELCRKAAATQANPIVFCGVRFMAETAKVLNPSRTVLLPAEHAGCSLAASITAEDVRELKQRYPGVPIVTYINTYADVKAECDIVCTSGNAAKIVSQFKSDTIIFLPDEYLAKNVAAETGKKVIFPSISSGSPSPQPQNRDNVMIGWRGRCEVHDQFTVDDIAAARQQEPDALILAHPECSPEVVAKSDFTGSTSAMIRYIQEHKEKRFLLLTECSMADNIAADNPEKEMVRMCSVRCPHMNEITLEDTLKALRENVQEITLPADVMERARTSIERMLAA
jgi:quinolinate synthase